MKTWTRMVSLELGNDCNIYIRVNKRAKLVVLNLPAARRGGDPFCIFIIYRHSTEYTGNELNDNKDQQDNIKQHLLILLVLLMLLASSSSLEISTLQEINLSASWHQLIYTTYKSLAPDVLYDFDLLMAREVGRLVYLGVK
jgi:hypothetical protein